MYQVNKLALNLKHILHCGPIAGALYYCFNWEVNYFHCAVSVSVMPCGALTLHVTDYSLTPKMFYVQEVNEFTFQHTTYFGRFVSFISLIHEYGQSLTINLHQENEINNKTLKTNVGVKIIPSRT